MFPGSASGRRTSEKGSVVEGHVELCLQWSLVGATLVEANLQFAPH